MKTEMRMFLAMGSAAVFLLFMFSRINLDPCPEESLTMSITSKEEDTSSSSSTEGVDTRSSEGLRLDVEHSLSKKETKTLSVSNSKASARQKPQTDLQFTFPSWFSEAWASSQATTRSDFLGDNPFFGQCKRSKKGIKGVPFVKPKDYLSQAKSPCWFDDPLRNKGFRCAPAFYLAGVAKCGTSDLYRRLRLHPEIMRGTMKEYHYWDHERFNSPVVSKDAYGNKIKPWTFEEYTDKVTGKPRLMRVMNEVLHEGRSDKLFGDGSPSYFWDVSHWEELEGNQGCDEPRVVIGQHIRHLYPQSKIVLIFRHPTQRLYSRFTSRLNRTSSLFGATSQTFHDYVVTAVQLYRDCFQRHSIRACAYNHTLYAEAVTRLAEGMYPVFMADWLRIWPREQMLILRNEDYGKDLEGTVQSVFDFLGVGTLNGSALQTVVGHAMSNVGDQYDRLGPILPETVKILDDFYEPFVRKFAQLLRDPRLLWEDFYPPAAASAPAP